MVNGLTRACGVLYRPRQPEIATPPLMVMPSVTCRSPSVVANNTTEQMFLQIILSVACGWGGGGGGFIGQVESSGQPRHWCTQASCCFL